MLLGKIECFFLYIGIYVLCDLAVGSCMALNLTEDTKAAKLLLSCSFNMTR